MANCEFSEFSYGFALTDSLVRFLGIRLGRAPIFPSLIQEGSAGGGYDLHIPTKAVPIFLQFKIPKVLTRRSSLMPSAYQPTYFRMPLRTKEPNQHQMLLDLQVSQPNALILYATPLFYEVDDLDEFFILHRVHKETAFIPPSRIGSLDSNSHHVSYKPGASTYWCHSEPREIGVGFDIESLVSALEERRALARNSDSSQDNDQRGAVRIMLTQLLSGIRNIRARENPPESRSGDGGERLLAFSQAPAVEDTTRNQRRLALDARLFQTDTDNVNLLAQRVAYVSQVKLGLTFALIDADDPQA
ncbi:MAG: hypothetical protein ING64_11865 [Rhodocyclaceae bacterium]|jgi:hypothetical protein|nr:hypothetical protein [Rhodocyclaceae bacterium]MCA3022363.1 hypothetical protein [Rhodocyclaceae bacterium]MCA3054521.1 hypothetical protein [Rhodocyclaceae bacterium]MCA3057035.1 hypothetical protein [Rhodocyclaceae bacterium]